MANTEQASAAERGRSKLLTRIKEAQAKAGRVSRGALAKTAQELDISLAEAFGTATFYSFITTEPTGRNIIRICKSVPCCLQEAEMIIDTVASEFDLLPGRTTADGRFTLKLTNCIGACDTAPAMLVNDDLHGDLTPARIVEILKTYA